MQLYSLTVQFDEYGEHKGKYIGNAHFKGQYGSVQVVLHPDISDEILRVCADGLVKASRELATQLTADTLMQARPALENKG